jgi:DNA-directed RNA polymerase specialized sigma subunit
MTITVSEEDRLTVEALRYYVPLFHAADDALFRLADEYDTLSDIERNRLESLAELSPLVTSRVSDLAKPLIMKIINSLLAVSAFRGKNDEVVNSLYWAGINGMTKGLRKFELEKLQKSSTNYLFQWIDVYIKKELAAMEAPDGVSISRFQRFKKIAAVRHKMTDELGYVPSDEEVHEYFVSGKADIKNLSGKIGSSDKPYKGNREMKIEDITDQRLYAEAETALMVFDPTDHIGLDVITDTSGEEPFEETVFGLFIRENDFTDEAIGVIMSEMGTGSVPRHIADAVAAMGTRQYSSVLKAWKSLIADPHGPFQKFLKNMEDHGAEVSGMVSTITQSISGDDAPAASSRSRNKAYSSLWKK